MLDSEQKESAGTLLYCSQDDGTEPSQTYHNLERLEPMYALDVSLGMIFASESANAVVNVMFQVVERRGSV